VEAPQLKPPGAVTIQGADTGRAAGQGGGRRYGAEQFGGSAPGHYRHRSTADRRRRAWVVCTGLAPARSGDRLRRFGPAPAPPRRRGGTSIPFPGRAKDVDAIPDGRPRPGYRCIPRSANIASAEHRPTLEILLRWAERIQTSKLAEVSTYFGKRGEIVLLPRLLPERAVLVSLYCYADGRPAVQFWRSVFDRRAPRSIDAVAAVARTDLGQGNNLPVVSAELMDALFIAYQDAATTGRNGLGSPDQVTTSSSRARLQAT
jgi:hypothetical protein